VADSTCRDFNNLLGSVYSLAESASAELDAGSSCTEELTLIRETAMRGSEIVVQLMIQAGPDGGDAGSASPESPPRHTSNSDQCL
jgi:hypothetical protein